MNIQPQPTIFIVAIYPNETTSHWSNYGIKAWAQYSEIHGINLVVHREQDPKIFSSLSAHYQKFAAFERGFLASTKRSQPV